MKKLEKYSNLIIALVFVIIVLAVYNTFDNFDKVMESISFIFKILSPFVTGFVIAYILNIPCKKINELLGKNKYQFIKKRSKEISIVIVYLLAALGVFVLIRAVVPAIYQNMLDLYYNIPIYFDEVIAALDKWQSENSLNIFEFNQMNAVKGLNDLLKKIDISEFSKYAKGVVNVTSGVINTFIGIIVSVYMLIDKEKIIASLKRVLVLFLKKERTNKLAAYVRRVNDIFSKYVFCLLVDAFIMSIFAIIVLTVLDVKYALILGGLIGLFNLIPYFGAIAAAFITVIITLITDGFFTALWVAVALLILQQVDGNFIGPKIMGQMLDASPLWIIFAVTLGGGLFGVLGMIISVPILMVIKMLVTDYIESKEKEIESE